MSSDRAHTSDRAQTSNSGHNVDAAGVPDAGPGPQPVGVVAEAFAEHPDELLPGLLALRALIIEVADESGITLEELLRWGQPTYRSTRPRQSTPVRLGSTHDGRFFGLYFHCQSSVVPRFRDAFPDRFRHEGNRAVLFSPGEDLQAETLRLCIGHALHYRTGNAATR